MYDFEEARRLAMRFDLLFPNFFVNATFVFNEERLEEERHILKHPEDADLVFDLPRRPSDGRILEYEYRLAHSGLKILYRYYKEELGKLRVEAIYFFTALLDLNLEYYEERLYKQDFIDLDSYSSFADEHTCLEAPAANEDLPLAYEDESFLKIFNRIGWWEIKKRLLLENGNINRSLEKYTYEDPKAQNYLKNYPGRWQREKHEDAEQLNFALNEEVDGRKCDIDLISDSYFFYRKPKISRSNINNDYTTKNEGLYYGLICPEISPQKRKRWSADYVTLTEFVLQGKYKIKDKVIEIEDLPWGRDNHSNDLDIIKGTAFSYQSCAIYLVNYIESKNNGHNAQEAYDKLMRLVYLTIKNIYPLEEKKIQYTDSILADILEYTRSAFDKTKEDNIDLNIKLNFFPEYQNTGYLPYEELNHMKQNAFFVEEIARRYAEPVTTKDKKCYKIAVWLHNAGLLKDEDMVRHINDFHEKSDKRKQLYIVYGELTELAIILETLYLVKDVITDDDLFYKTDQICKQIQNYIYESIRFRQVQEQLDSINPDSFELNATQYISNKKSAFMYEYNSWLLRILQTPKISFDDFMNERQIFAKRIYTWGLDSETTQLMEELNANLLSLLQQKVSQQANFSAVLDEAKRFLQPYFYNINVRFGNYLNGNYDISEFKNVVTKELATAQYLYAYYVEPYKNTKPPAEMRDLDLSFVALEYYLALERAANELLYIHYKDKVLCNLNLPRHPFDRDALGYIGKSRINNLYAHHIGWKNNLEIGTVSFLYKGMDPNYQGTSDVFLYIKKYLADLGLSSSRVRRIAEIATKLYNIRDLRNMAAHGASSLTISEAKKAQDICFEHDPHPDSSCSIRSVGYSSIDTIVDSYQNLIKELFECFS